MNLQRLSNESDFAYHKRLVYGKLVDKTLGDVDYRELALHLYGKEYAPDVARRMVYGSKRTIDIAELALENGITSDEMLATIEQKKTELRRETQRFRDQRREFSKVATKSDRMEHLFETLIEAAFELEDTVGTLFVGKEKPKSDTDQTEAVLVLSDWHYGMVADNIFNTYNTEICKNRVESLVESSVKKLKVHNVDKLHIVILGDLIHGAIHTSARVASEELVVEQIMQVAEILAQAIAKLSLCVNSVDVHSTYGNHARTIQNKSDSIHSDNMEKIIPWWLNQRLQGGNVKIADSNLYEFLMIDICGYKFCGVHGDLDTVQNSPKTLTTLFSKKLGIDIDYVLLGDKHHRESFEELGVSAMMCGSLCGSDDYANDRRLYSPPSQLLMIVEPDEGITAEYRLKNFNM